MRGYLTPVLQRVMDIATREKGSSSWLSVMPLDGHEFFLHKGPFVYALALR